MKPSSLTPQNSKTILYVSEIEPTENAASSAVIHRHLRSLQDEGYHICVALTETDRPPPNLPATWTVIQLPRRRLYFPPYRPNAFLRYIRWNILDQFVISKLSNLDVHCIIGCLNGEYLVNYAAWLSEKLSLPLFYFYHDRGEDLAFSKDPKGARRLRRQNLRLLQSPFLEKFWAVSPELNYPELGNSTKRSVLYPLPERIEGVSKPVWNAGTGAGPTVVHIGTIYLETVDSMRAIISALQSVGGKLIIYSHRAEPGQLLHQEFPTTVDFRGFVDDTLEMLKKTMDETTAFLVVYPDDVNSMPWAKESFPSKFVQMVQTGLPGIVIAPAETSIAKWCLANNWKLYCPTVNSPELMKLILSLNDPAGWNEAALHSRQVSEEVFSPDKIESQVIADIRQICQLSMTSDADLIK
jgi:hypothetical protein